MKALADEDLCLMERYRERPLYELCETLAGLDVEKGPGRCATGQSCTQNAYGDYTSRLKSSARQYQRTLDSPIWKPSETESEDFEGFSFTPDV